MTQFATVAIRDHGVSTRESDIIDLVIQGLRNKEVAEQLFITEKTVKFHLTSIYKKMKCSSRAQLMARAMEYTSQLPGYAPLFPSVKRSQSSPPMGDVNNNGAEA